MAKGKKGSKKGGKKGKAEARRAELEEMSLFRLKRAARGAGLDADDIREAQNEEELIEAILDAEFGDGGKPPKKAAKKGGKKGKKEEPEDDPEEDDPEEDGGDDEDDDGSDDDDDGSDDDEGGDDDDEGEDEPPKRTAVRSKKSSASDDEPDVLEEKIDAVIDGLATVRGAVEEIKADTEAIYKFVNATLQILKSSALRIGKAVGTKGLKKKIEDLENETLSEDD